MGDTVKYKVKVGLKKENTISKNVVIRDQIPDGMKLDENSIKVEGITDYTINVDGNKMEVKIPTLRYGEEVTVTYEAKVLKGAAGIHNKTLRSGRCASPARFAPWRLPAWSSRCRPHPPGGWSVPPAGCGRDRKSTRLNSSHTALSRMPSSA